MKKCTVKRWNHFQGKMRFTAVLLALFMLLGGSVIKSDAALTNTSGKSDIFFLPQKVVMYPEMVKNLSYNGEMQEIAVMTTDGKKNQCQIKKVRVNWKTSNKKIVRIIGKRGTGDETVILKSGNKTGTAIVSAQVMGKTYRCKVTVKNDKKTVRAKLKRTKFNGKEWKVVVTFANGTGKENCFGNLFSLKRLENGKWVDVEMDDTYAFAEIAYVLPEYSKRTKSYSLSTYYSKTELKKGWYCLYTNLTTKKSFQKVYFQIRQKDVNSYKI